MIRDDDAEEDGAMELVTSWCQSVEPGWVEEEPEEEPKEEPEQYLVP